MGTSLSLLQVTGIPSSIYNRTHDLWDLLSIKLHITMQHAVHPIAFVETEPLKALTFSRCTVLKHTARGRILTETKIFQLKSQEACFCLAETNDHYFCLICRKKQISYIYLLLKPYAYLEGFIAFFKPYNIPGKLVILKSSIATKTLLSLPH